MDVCEGISKVDIETTCTTPVNNEGEDVDGEINPMKEANLVEPQPIGEENPVWGKSDHSENNECINEVNLPTDMSGYTINVDQKRTGFTAEQGQTNSECEQSNGCTASNNTDFPSNTLDNGSVLGDRNRNDSDICTDIPATSVTGINTEQSQSSHTSEHNEHGATNTGESTPNNDIGHCDLYRNDRNTNTITPSAPALEVRAAQWPSLSALDGQDMKSVSETEVLENAEDTNAHDEPISIHPSRDIRASQTNSFWDQAMDTLTSRHDERNEDLSEQISHDSVQSETNNDTLSFWDQAMVGLSGGNVLGPSSGNQTNTTVNQLTTNSPGSNNGPLNSSEDIEQTTRNNDTTSNTQPMSFWNEAMLNITGNGNSVPSIGEQRTTSSATDLEVSANNATSNSFWDQAVSSIRNRHQLYVREPNSDGTSNDTRMLPNYLNEHYRITRQVRENQRSRTQNEGDNMQTHREIITEASEHDEYVRTDTNSNEEETMPSVPAPDYFHIFPYAENQTGQILPNKELDIYNGDNQIEWPEEWLAVAHNVQEQPPSYYDVLVDQEKYNVSC